MGHGDTARQVFAEELASINDPAIRDFVIEVFEKLGTTWFWTRPCSLSGRYHPQLAQGQSGLVRHTKYGVYWAKELARACFGSGRGDDTGLYGDHVVAAVLLHDLMKDGDTALSGQPERLGNAGKSYITGCHGVDLANAIWTQVLGQKASTDQILILYGIAAHMGVWTKPEQYRPSNISNELCRSVATVVHLADYCASRKADDFIAKMAQQMQSMQVTALTQ